MITSSRPGSHTIRYKRSIASSLPFPTNISEGETPLIAATRFFSSICNGSGYLFQPLPAGEPFAFSLASSQTSASPLNSAGDEYGSRLRMSRELRSNQRHRNASSIRAGWTPHAGAPQGPRQRPLSRSLARGSRFLPGSVAEA